MGNAAAPGQGINAFLREQRIEIVDVLFRKGTCRAFRKGQAEIRTPLSIAFFISLVAGTSSTKARAISMTSSAFAPENP